MAFANNQVGFSILNTWIVGNGVVGELLLREAKEKDIQDVYQFQRKGRV